MIAGAKLLNLLVRFLLELGILAAVGYWGFTTAPSWWGKVAFGLGAPLLLAVAWGLFGSPKAPYPLAGMWLLLFELLFFGTAPAALFAVGKPTLAWSFVIGYLVNKALLTFWQQ